MIDSLQGAIELRGGFKMPGYGYGCYKAEGEDLEKALLYALNLGYRLVDTAAFYKNEATVGATIKKSGIGRDQLFIVSKIWPSSFENARAALDASLKALQLDYLDAYLLHWPGLDERARYHAWETLLRESEKGKIRMPGVSNFLEHHLESLHDNFKQWPGINQIEVHPDFQEFGLCNFCEKREIAIMSWSPLGRGNVLENPVLVEIGKKYNKTAPQVALRWQVQMAYVPLPKSVHDSRIRENADIFDFTLSGEDMKAIKSLDLPDDRGRIGKNPDKWPVD